MRKWNTRASVESLPASLSRIMSIPTGRVPVLLHDEINDDDPPETQVHEEARDPHDENEDEDDWTLPEGKNNRGRDGILSKITEEDPKERLELNRMLLKLWFKQDADWKEERTRMLTELDRSGTIDRPENSRNQSQIFKTVDPLGYCGGAKELDKFLETLRSNFAWHNHLFPRGDPDKVKYAVSFLDTWDNHPDLAQRQTDNTDTSEWASDLHEAKDPCLENFELLTNDLQQIYGDTDRGLISATTAMQEYQQLPNEPVRVCVNRSKRNWRRAGWTLITHEVVLYNLAWAGLRQTLKTQVRPWIPSGKDRFDTLDQLFVCAAAFGVPTGRQKNPRDSNSKGKQGSFRKAGLRNVIFNHPSPNLQKSLPVIPLIPTIPVFQNRASPISPVEAVVPTSHQRRGFQRKSMKAKRQAGNALALAVETTKPIFVPNTARRAHLNRTSAITAAMTANKSSAEGHSKRCSKKTSLLLSVSNSTREGGQSGVRIGEHEQPSVLSNLG